MSQADAPTRSPRRRRRTVVRFVLFPLVSLAILVCLGLYLVTRSPVLVALITPQLEQELNGEVTIGWAEVVGTQEIRLHDVVVRSPHHPGPAGEVIAVETVIVGTDLLGLLRGYGGDLDLTLVAPLFRMSEDEHAPGLFTFMELGGPSSADSSSRPVIVNVQNGAVEVGTHDGIKYTPGATLPVAGTLYTTRSELEWLYFDLSEIDSSEQAVPDGIRAKGRLNLQTFANEGRVDGLRFDPRIRGMCPIAVKVWWDQFDLTGRVEDATIRSDLESGIWARIDVSDVELTIPITAKGVWARYEGGISVDGMGFPRMHVSSGQIELKEGRVYLRNLTGELTSSVGDDLVAGVPYRVNGSIGPVPEFDWDERDEWVDYALNKSPVDLSFYLEGFRFDGDSGGPNSAVELPAVMTRVLELFKLRSCTLDTNVEIERAPPIADANGGWIGQQLLTHGTAVLEDGSGVYAKFPYPLEQVSARLEFDNDRLDLVSLLGRGVSGGSISIAGTIASPDRAPGVDLHISATDVPVGQSLRDAMSEQFQAVLDSLMPQDSLDRLDVAGVLPNEESMQVLQDRAIELERQRIFYLAESAGDDDPTDRARRSKRLERRIASLDRAIKAGPPNLGGVVDFELDVTRRQGPDNPTETSGTIVLRDAGLVFDRFPYPVTVQRGTIELFQDRAVLHDWLGTTSGGGHVLIDGEIASRMIEGKKKVFPNLTIGVVDDLLNPALIEAIRLAGADDRPEADEESALEVAARLLDAAGLDGLISYDSAVTRDPAGRVKWDIAVVLEDGVARPKAVMAQTMESFGLIWPKGFALDEVEGSFRVTEDRIDIARLTGWRGAGEVEASGTIEVGLGELKTDVEVEFRRFALEEYLLDFFPTGGVDRVRSFWDRYQPEGEFDASLAYVTAPGQSEPVELSVRPRRVAMTVAGQRVEIEGAGDGASITVRDGSVEFNNLGLVLASEGTTDGVVVLDGSYGTDQADDIQLALSGTVTNARLESPWVLEALHVLGASEYADEYSALQPRGLFDGTFVYQPETSAGKVTIRPRTVQFTRAGTEVAATFEEGSEFEIARGKASLHQIAGTLKSGAAFAVMGEVSLEDGVDADLTVSYRGVGLAPELAAFLPEMIPAALDSVSFGVEERLSVNGAQLHIWRPPGSDIWSQTFHGPVEVVGGFLKTGIEIKDLNAVLDIDLARVEASQTTLTVGVRADRLLAESRHLTNLVAEVVLSDDGRALLLPTLTADCYHGTLTANAKTGFSAGEPYQLEVDLVGVSLGEFSLGEPTGEDGDSKPAEGSIYANMSVRGTLGDISSRLGRGTVRVLDGDLANNPVTLPLLQLSQLMLPLDASLAYAEAEMFLRGERLVFESIFFESDRLLLFGDGSMMLSDYEMDVRLRSRGRLVGVSDVIGSINDQLFAIHVTGPLSATSAAIVPLPGLGGFLRDGWIDRHQPTLTTVPPSRAGVPD